MLLVVQPKLQRAYMGGQRNSLVCPCACGMLSRHPKMLRQVPCHILYAQHATHRGMTLSSTTVMPRVSYHKHYACLACSVSMGTCLGTKLCLRFMPQRHAVVQQPVGVQANKRTHTEGLCRLRHIQVFSLGHELGENPPTHGCKGKISHEMQFWNL